MVALRIKVALIYTLKSHSKNINAASKNQFESEKNHFV